MAGQGDNTARDSKSNNKKSTNPTPPGQQSRPMPQPQPVGPVLPANQQSRPPGLAGFMVTADGKLVYTGKRTVPDRIDTGSNKGPVQGPAAWGTADTPPPASFVLNSLIPDVKPVTASGGGGGGGKAGAAANAVTKSLDQLIADTQQKIFDTSVYDTRRKYLEEQLNTAKAVKAASEDQARLQYQALARLAQEQQAAAEQATQGGYSEALAQIAEQGAAQAAIGGGVGAALSQQMAQQQLADQAALREIGATAAGGAQSASALQELINQAYGRDLAAAQARQAGAIEAEQVSAASQFEQQRAQDLANLQLQRAKEVQSILDKQAAARAKAASDAAAAAAKAASAPSPSSNMFTTGIGTTVQSRQNKMQDQLDSAGNPVKDKNGNTAQEPWGIFRTKTVGPDGVVKQDVVDTRQVGTDVMLYAASINSLMTATTGANAAMSKTDRTNAAIAQVQAMNAALVDKYGSSVLQAISAPVSKGGLGLPSDPVQFVKQAATGGK